jgi:hypothetical protein
VGSNPLFNRGMNAAPAIFGNYLYVGNRSDGSNTCPHGTTGCPHVDPGILILNIADLKYTGPHASEVAGINFLEGNSNLGDAVRLANS